MCLPVDVETTIFLSFLCQPLTRLGYVYDTHKRRLMRFANEEPMTLISINSYNYAIYIYSLVLNKYPFAI